MPQWIAPLHPVSNLKLNDARMVTNGEHLTLIPIRLSCMVGHISTLPSVLSISNCLLDLTLAPHQEPKYCKDIGTTLVYIPPHR